MTKSSEILPSPNQLGLPERFSEWYPGQDRAVSWLMDAIYQNPGPGPRFMALAAPTGSGKTIIAALAGTLSDRRTIILTATKGLQQQYMDQVGDIGLADLRGANAYGCSLESGLRADEGPCRVGASCHNYCPHQNALHKAAHSQMVVTNYACWFHNATRLNEKGSSSLLVLDEAHRAYNALSEYCSIEYSSMDLDELGAAGVGESTGIDSWRLWAKGKVRLVDGRYQDIMDQVKEFTVNGTIPPRAMVRESHRLKSLLDRLNQTMGIDDRWVVGEYRKGYRLCPIVPAEFAESNLFHGMEKVLLMSATLTPKTLDLLGIPDRERCFLELPSSFPVRNRPVIHIPTVRMNHKASMDDRMWWVARIDQIIQDRLDRKGIVHTTSYPRRNLLMQNSRFRDIMVTHDTAGIQAAVRKFKESPSPAVLVSPSITDGFDFPEDDCGYIVIGKVPWPDTRDPIARARSDRDKAWGPHEAMQTVIQSAGRGIRTPTDMAECIIVDDDWVWFWKRYSHMAPVWFQQAVRFDTTIPKPFF